MADDRLYAWNPFSTWVGSIVSSDCRLLDGTTWRPGIGQRLEGVGDTRTYMLPDEYLTQTHTYRGNTYTATFKGFEVLYTGTYPDWQTRVTVSGQTVTVDVHSDYKSDPPKDGEGNPLTAGLLRFVAQWDLTDDIPDTGVPIHGKIGTLLFGANGLPLYRG